LTDNLKNVQAEPATSFLRNSYPNAFLNIVTIPVTEVELTTIINSLKTKKSSGYDEITNKILKLCGPHVNKLLSYIYNKSISVGIFCDQLKYAVVKSLFKKVIFNQSTNSIFKIFEITFRRSNQHLQVHNI